ncbi:hypothetical protein [Zavarzinia aquatilis]|uniref:Superinfection immunity protein n=1 Tax=Zavarzinia aquatilis TaxID=2211142 RepID=A0A317EFC5_9PROT|nr:hypothetical protein [Zavarzinia aquatilis]PWR25697.1 hypothetical protein DKG74_01670 [Zavarzinia aquatilis]
MESVLGILIAIGFFLPSIIAGQRRVLGHNAVILLNLMVVTWPWALAFAFSPFTRDFLDGCDRPPR